MITADQSLRYQQYMKGRLLTLIVLNTNNRPLIRQNLDQIVAAISRAESVDFQELALTPAAD